MDQQALDPNAEHVEVSALDEEDAFEKLVDWYEADDEHSAKWRKTARECFDFYAGRQWSPEDRSKMEAQNRPPITFNRCIAIIKSICGLEINSRHDTIYLPRESDQEEVRANEILTAGSNWMADSCDAEDEQSEAFQDTTICGMGWTEAVVDFEREPDGMYVETKVDPLEMRWDRNARSKNLADAKRKWRARSMPIKDAMDMFPKADVDDLDASSWARNDTGEPLATKTREQKRKREENTAYYEPRAEVTIVHAQWIERETYHRVAHPKIQLNMMGQPQIAGYEELELTAEEFAEYKAQADEAGLPYESTDQKRPVYKQAFLGKKILSGIMPGPCGNAFSWNCITGERDQNEGTWFGLIEIMRDPQMWANKWLTQTLHILNSSAKGGILAEKGAFSDIREAQKTYAKADHITEVADKAISGNRIMQKPGTAIAGPYVQLMEFAISAIRDVPGVNLEILGMADRNQAGILEHQRKQAGLTILATLFDSLRRFRKRVGRVRLYYLQEHFADGRLVRVAGPDGRKFMRLIKDRMLGKYDVEVDDAPTSPNQREQNWLIIQQFLPIIRDQIDPETMLALLEHSPLPAQVIEMLKQTIAKPKPGQEERTKLEMRGAEAEITGAEAKAQQAKAAAMKSRAGAILDLANAYTKGSEVQLNQAKAGQIQRAATIDELMAQIKALASDVIDEPQSGLPQVPQLPTGLVAPPTMDMGAMLELSGSAAPELPTNGQGLQQ